MKFEKFDFLPHFKHKATVEEHFLNQTWIYKT